VPPLLRPGVDGIGQSQTLRRMADTAQAWKKKPPEAVAPGVATARWHNAEEETTMVRTLSGGSGRGFVGSGRTLRRRLQNKRIRPK
jgi:hypothetical protein